MKSLITATAVSLALSIATAEAATKKRVSFESAGQTLAGDLFLPDSYQDGQTLPGVVITGAWTTVKEQMPATYAALLADRGYAALVFDFRGWGQSQGAIRYLEDPLRKIADINAAVDFLTARPEVDRARIAGLGICASAGYMSDAALQNVNIKALALVAPWLHDAAIVETVYGGEHQVAELIATSRRAAAGAEPVILEAASTENENAVMFQVPYYTEAGRGLIPEYDNRFNAASWEPWLTYDAIQTADRLHKPTLLVHADTAAIPQGAREFAARMGRNATVLWLDNVSQFDFYDKPDTVQTAADAVIKHFNRALDVRGQR